MANSAFSVAGLGGGAYTYISQQTASSSSSLTFAIPSGVGYIAYDLVATDVIMSSSGANLNFTVNGDTGANYDYSWLYSANNNTSGIGSFGSGANSINLVTTLSNTQPLDFWLRMYNPGSGASYRAFTWQVSYINAAGVFANETGGGYHAVNAAVTSLTLTPSAGNITSGTFTLYGISTSTSAIGGFTAKAYITYSTAGGVFTMLGSSGNVTGTYNSVGNVTLTFPAGLFTDANYTAIASHGNGVNTNGYSAGWSQCPGLGVDPTSTSTTVQTTGSTGAAQETYFSNVVFFGT